MFSHLTSQLSLGSLSNESVFLVFEHSMKKDGQLNIWSTNSALKCRNKCLKSISLFHVNLNNDFCFLLHLDSFESYSPK